LLKPERQIPSHLAGFNAPTSGRYNAPNDTLREQLAIGLSSLSWAVVPGCANFLLAHLPNHHPPANELIARCREHGLFLRDVSNMGTVFNNRAIRVAVKAAESQHRMLEILKRVLPATQPASRWASALGQIELVRGLTASGSPNDGFGTVDS